MSGVEVGQVWREDDKRFERYVRVVWIDGDKVAIRACDRDGAFDLGRPRRMASLRRFGKSGGYKLP